MAMIGYARVSTEEQCLDLQRDALKTAGCKCIYEDAGVSAVAKRRPEFEAALEALKPDDVFMVWKMDRAFRSMRHACDVLELFEAQHIEFIAITEQIDTTTAMGKFVYHIRNAFSVMERDLLSERTKAGMEAARKRGKTLGRPKLLSSEEIAHAKLLLDSDPQNTLTSIAGNLNVNPRTLSRAIAIYD